IDRCHYEPGNTTATRGRSGTRNEIVKRPILGRLLVVRRPLFDSTVRNLVASPIGVLDVIAPGRRTNPVCGNYLPEMIYREFACGFWRPDDATNAVRRRQEGDSEGIGPLLDRKSTRLNSSHANISY